MLPAGPWGEDGFYLEEAVEEEREGLESDFCTPMTTTVRPPT
jgi:hypothetical protein